MVKSATLSVRVEEDLGERLAEYSERYEMTESQLVRLMVRQGLATMDGGGLEALVAASMADKPDPIDA